MSSRPPVDLRTQELITRMQKRARGRRRARGLILIVAALTVVIASVLIAVVVARPAQPAGTKTGPSVVSSGPGATVATTTLGGGGDHESSGTGASDGGSGTISAQTTSTNIVDSGGASPTTTKAATTTAPPSTTSTVKSASGNWVVVIDPGHQAKGNYNEEPIGPGSSSTKAKVSSGTAGVSTGILESELNLAVSLLLRDELVARGVKVIMTRTTQNVNISNIERTKIANEAGADLFIRIHADGADSSSAHGIHVLYPAVVKGWTDDIAAPSKRAAALAQAALIAATGAKDLGIDARDDMTGFNWSDVPVIIPEMGFMTNPDEDRLLATADYRKKIAKALADATVRFLRE